jgi:hypothetical protein
MVTKESSKMLLGFAVVYRFAWQTTNNFYCKPDYKKVGYRMEPDTSRISMQAKYGKTRVYCFLNGDLLSTLGTSVASLAVMCY